MVELGDIQGVEQAPLGGCELFKGQWQSLWAWVNGVVEVEGIETAKSEVRRKWVLPPQPQVAWHPERGEAEGGQNRPQPCWLKGGHLFSC